MTKSEATRQAKLFNTMPGSIRIGPYDYSVSIVSEPLMLDGSEKVGICHPQLQSIELGAKWLTTPEQTVGVLIHEVLHGVWANANLPKKVNEEQAVSALETGLLSLFRDNPELLDYIKKALK